MKEIRLVIAVPSTSLWQAQFGMSLLFMTNYLASHHMIDGKSMHYRVHNKRGSILANMRQDMIMQAIKGDATHLLFVDSDQTFPRDTVHRLLSHKKQVVACNIATKMIPSTPTARYRGKGTAGVPVYSGPSSPPLEEVWRVGTGVMLIDLNIFKRKELKEPPWFDQPWNPELQSYSGEDWSFCAALQKAGVKIYVDHQLSLEIGHLGNLEYGHDLVVIDAEQEAS